MASRWRCRGEGYINEYAKDQDKDDLGRLQIHSWSIYGVKGSSYDREYGVDGFTDSEDMSIGFFVANSADVPLNNVDLTATVTGGKIKVAWAYANNGQEFVNTCDDGGLDSHFSSTGDSAQDINSFDYNWYNEGYYYLCIKPVGKTTLGTSTLTVKANGVTIYSNTVQVIGDLRSLTLSITDGYNRVSADNSAYGSFFTVLGKDRAGQVINKVDDGFYNDLEDWTDSGISQNVGEEDVLNSDGDPIDFFYDTDFSQYEQGENVVGLDSYVCLDGDAGESYAASLQMENYYGSQITSNGVTLICTGAADEYVIASSGVSQVSNFISYGANAILHGEADWLASAVGAGDATGQIDIYVVIKDQDGAFMGVDGSTGVAFGYDIGGTFSSDLDINDNDVGAIGAGGKLVIGGYVPYMVHAAKFKIVVTINDANGGTALNQELVVNLFYQVSSIDSEFTLTRVRNAAKTRTTWTADWGLACSNALVMFDWVNGAGTKGTLVNGYPLERRANFDGVATFTLARRNVVIFVTAYACDDFEDSPDTLGPVKARFR